MKARDRRMGRRSSRPERVGFGRNNMPISRAVMYDIDFGLAALTRQE